MTTRDLICCRCGSGASVFDGALTGDESESIVVRCETCRFAVGPFCTEEGALAAYESICWILSRDKLAPEVRHKADLPCNCLDHITPDCEYHKWLRAQK